MNDEPEPMTPYEFILELYGNVPAGYLELTYLAPDGVKLFPRTAVVWADLPLGDIDPAMPRVHHLNQLGYGAYFGVAVRGVKYPAEERVSEKTGRPYKYYPRGKAHDAIFITTLWVDIDIPGDDGYRKLLEMAAPPSFIVSSGGGWHGYWLLIEPLAIDDFNRDSILRTLRGMALACDGDTKVADLARIMRLPGTVNTKPGRGTVCRIVDSIPFRYIYEQLEVAYAPLAAPVRPQVTRALPTLVNRTIPPWIERYIQSGAVQGSRNDTLNKAAWQLFNDGHTHADVMNLLAGRAAADGLDDHEIETTITSAQRAKRGAPSLDPSMQTAMAADDHLLNLRRRGK